MPPTVCWFIQSHRDPEQIVRLLRVLRAGSDGPIVLRHDDDATRFDPTPALALGNVHLLAASGRQVRGSFSCQVQPYIDAIDWLDETNVAYDWLINLTAQDYPVRPVSAIEHDLAVATCDGFVRWWDVLGSESPWSVRKARARYWHRYRLLPPGSERGLRLLRWLTRLAPLHFYLDYGAWVGVRRWSVPFRDELRCMGGRSWWTLRRDVVRYFREFLRARPDVVDHYRGTIAPEESLVPTVLVASRRFDLVNDDLRYIDYSNAIKGSPRTLSVADVPMLAAGGYHFARKFDLSVDREVLDVIDRTLLDVSLDRVR
ncbi:MAG: hypothetical protein HYU52_06430 [Acidobacteria bacterium]|nr:hypothetical protein [Acidobacteriota bacterium]